MFVCGGLSTCCSVCCGVVNCVRRRRRPAGRQLAKAPRSIAAAAAEAATPVLPAPVRRRRSRCRRSRRATCRCRPASSGTARRSDAGCSAGSGRSVRRSSASQRSSGRRPPDAWRGASSPTSPARRSRATATCFAAVCWNVSCEPGKKKSCTKCVPGLPSFDRSVITDWFARSGRGCRGRRRARRRRTRPGSAAARGSPSGRCRFRASGSSVFFCARSRPADRLAIAMTSATPSPKPSNVTIVRPRRRTNSLRK